MSFLERAIKDGYANITGVENKQKITYVSSDNHTENYNDPEEKVRAEFWAELIYEYDYPAHRIKVEVTIPDRIPNDRADIVIFADDECKKPYAVVECKRDGVTDAEFLQAIEQGVGNATWVKLRAKYVVIIAGATRRVLDFSDDNTGIFERETNIIANITTLRVAEIQRFCMHDGPGVRTTVFFKGCPLRCVWCHNPEMQKSARELLFFGNKCISCRLCASCVAHSFDGGEHTVDREKCTSCGKCAELCPTTALQICGRDMTVDEIVREVKKDVAFYGLSGGVTLSGGEPLAQAGVVDLLKALKSDGINTAIETCGYFDVSAVLPYTDLFLWDVKDTDPARHEKYTGATNERILENLFAADEMGAKTRLRCIIINGVNDDVDHYRRVHEIKAKLKNCTGADILPYHAYGGSKAVALGLPDNGDTSLIPTDDEISEAKRIICG